MKKTKIITSILLSSIISSQLFSTTIDDIYIHKLENKIFDNISKEKKIRFINFEEYEFNSNLSNKNYKFKLNEVNLPILYSKLITDLKNIYNEVHQLNYINYDQIHCLHNNTKIGVDVNCNINNLRFENFKIPILNNQLNNIKIKELKFHEKNVYINYNYFIFKDTEYMLLNQYKYFMKNLDRLQKLPPINYYEKLSNKKIDYYLKDNLYNYLIKLDNIKLSNIKFNDFNINNININNINNLINLILNNNLNYYNDSKNIKLKFDFKINKNKIKKFNNNDFIPPYMLDFLNQYFKYNDIKLNFDIDMNIKKYKNQIILQFNKFNIKSKDFEIKSKFELSLNTNNFYILNNNLEKSLTLLNSEINIDIDKLNQKMQRYYKIKNHKQNNKNKIKNQQNKLDLKMINNFDKYKYFLGNITKFELYKYILPTIRGEKNYINFYIDNYNFLTFDEIKENIKLSFEENININDVIKIDYDFIKK